jgi:hypothetical protein
MVAMSGDTINELGLNDMEEYTANLPAVTIMNGPIGNLLFIRGVGTAGINAGIEQSGLSAPVVTGWVSRPELECPAKVSAFGVSQQGCDFLQGQLRVLQVIDGQAPAHIIQNTLEAGIQFAQLATQRARAHTQFVGNRLHIRKLAGGAQQYTAHLENKVCFAAVPFQHLLNQFETNPGCYGI